MTINWLGKFVPYSLDSRFMLKEAFTSLQTYPDKPQTLLKLASSRCLCPTRTVVLRLQLPKCSRILVQCEKCWRMSYIHICLQNIVGETALGWSREAKGGYFVLGCLMLAWGFELWHLYEVYSFVGCFLPCREMWKRYPLAIPSHKIEYRLYDFCTYHLLLLEISEWFANHCV